MNDRCLVFVAVTAVALLVPVHAAGQARTPWGDPDLQEIWTSSTLTPLERPSELAGKEVLTEEEAAESTSRELVRIDGDQRVGAGEGDRQSDTPDGRTDVGRAYNEFWRDRGRMLPQTSLIVDPLDGRIPYRPEARPARRGDGPGAIAGPEDRGLAERCILWSSAGPPMLPTTYNSNFQLLQTPNYVVILNEMIHDVRIVPLDGRPHLGDDIRQWLGDSRGHWDSETLVVETTNFTDKTQFRGSTARLQLVERFTRVSADTLRYEFTVDDQSAWTRPWTAAWPLATLQSALSVQHTAPVAQLFEYACHEGNYGLTGQLAGARAEEKAAEEAAGRDSR